MKENLRKKLSLGLLCFALLLGLQSCYEPIEGCLDPTAQNFEFESDNRCDSCCTYPTLTLAFDYLYDSLNFNTSSFYFDAQQDSFRILNFSFLVSNFELQNTLSGNPISVSDSISIKCDTNSIMTPNTFFTLTNRSRSARANSFRFYQNVQDIGFRVGLDSCAVLLDPDNLDNDFTTFRNISSLRDSMGNWIYQRMTFAMPFDTTVIDSFAMPVDTVLVDTFQIIVDQPIDISLEKSFDFTIGRNITIDIEVNVEKWLENVDFSNMDSTMVAEQLFFNTADMFKIIE